MTTDIYQALSPLWDDLAADHQFPNHRPLLAHYTSVETLGEILSNQEVWFSNPLFMNDRGELRTGMNLGRDVVQSSKVIEDAMSPPHYKIFLDEFNKFWENDDNGNAFKVFVFATSLHDEEQIGDDGLLSMWRGYGKHGLGAAIVFDTSKLPGGVLNDSPIALSKILYLSDEQRQSWIVDLVARFADILREQKLTDANVCRAAYSLFARIKIFAIYSKHKGFGEEQEWRVLYMQDRDTEMRFSSLVGFAHTPRGPQPKFKLRAAPMSDRAPDALKMFDLVHKIIVGPALSDPRSFRGVLAMIDQIAPELSARVVCSSIPYGGHN